MLVKHTTRNRLYVRRFDHFEAHQRWLAGERVADLATEYSVTPAALYRAFGALTPEGRDRQNAYQRSWRTTVCEQCGGPAMRLVTNKKPHNPDGRVLCQRCRGITRRGRFRYRPDGTLEAVRCNRVDCVNEGGRWQPPDRFPGGPRYRDVRPQGIHGACRACNTMLRRAHRQAQKVPCTNPGCTNLSLPGNNRRTDSGLCAHCARRQPRRT